MTLMLDELIDKESMRPRLLPLAVLLCPLALAGQSVPSDQSVQSIPPVQTVIKILPAQSAGTPPYEIYAGYSLLSNSFNGVPGSRQALNGEEASFAFPGWHGLRVKIDVTRFSGHNLGARQQATFIMGRRGIRAHVPPGAVICRSALRRCRHESLLGTWGAFRRVGLVRDLAWRRYRYPGEPSFCDPR